MKTESDKLHFIVFGIISAAAALPLRPCFWQHILINQPENKAAHLGKFALLLLILNAHLYLFI